MAGFTPWTDELIAELKRLWAEGWSASEIATQLDAGFSRNGVIGKASRLGLERRAPERPYKKPQLKIRTRKKVPRPMFPSPPPPPPAPPPSPQQRPVQFFDLQERHCRWPLGELYERAKFFCGENRCGSGPYCAEHTRISFSGSR